MYEKYRVKIRNMNRHYIIVGIWRTCIPSVLYNLYVLYVYLAAGYFIHDTRAELCVLSSFGICNRFVCNIEAFSHTQAQPIFSFYWLWEYRHQR